MRDWGKAAVCAAGFFLVTWCVYMAEKEYKVLKSIGREEQAEKAKAYAVSGFWAALSLAAGAALEIVRGPRQDAGHVPGRRAR